VVSSSGEDKANYSKYASDVEKEEEADCCCLVDSCVTRLSMPFSHF
jgi:hypothetical protein